MSDLTWLAENVHEWCQDAKWIYRMGPQAFFWWGDDQCPTSFARAQWQAERERLGLDKPAWNGEGLPPVGEGYEYDTGFQNWFPCKVTCHCVDHGQDGAVVQTANRVFIVSGDEVAQRIRRVGTQQEREREELAEIVMQARADELHVYALADAIIAAGWRKQS